MIIIRWKKKHMKEKFYKIVKRLLLGLFAMDLSATFQTLDNGYGRVVAQINCNDNG